MDFHFSFPSWTSYDEEEWGKGGHGLGKVWYMF